MSNMLAVQTLTATLRTQLDEGLPAALQREAEQQAICYARKDLLEGIAAVKGDGGTFLSVSIK